MVVDIAVASVTFRDINPADTELIVWDHVVGFLGY